MCDVGKTNHNDEPYIKMAYVVTCLDTNALRNCRKNKCVKAVVNTVGGLLASRRVFSWLPLVFFCSYSTDPD